MSNNGGLMVPPPNQSFVIVEPVVGPSGAAGSAGPSGTAGPQGPAGAAGIPATTTEVEFTFGVTPVREATFTRPDAAATIGARINACRSANAPTNLTTDEALINPLIITGVCLVGGTITFYVRPIDGVCAGNFKVLYWIG